MRKKTGPSASFLKTDLIRINCLYKKEFIGKTSTLLSDIIETHGLFHIEKFLIIRNNKKAFHYNFLHFVLKKIEFRKIFINWIEKLLKD